MLFKGFWLFLWESCRQLYTADCPLNYLLSYQKELLGCYSPHSTMSSFNLLSFQNSILFFYKFWYCFEGFSWLFFQFFLRLSILISSFLLYLSQFPFSYISITLSRYFNLDSIVYDVGWEQSGHVFLRFSVGASKFYR